MLIFLFAVALAEASFANVEVSVEVALLSKAEFEKVNPRADDIRTLSAGEGNGTRGGGDPVLGDNLRHLFEIASVKAEVRDQIITLAKRSDNFPAASLERTFLRSSPIALLENEDILVLPSCRDEDNAIVSLALNENVAVTCISAPVFSTLDSMRSALISILLARADAATGGVHAFGSSSLYDVLSTLKIDPRLKIGGFETEAEKRWYLADQSSVASIQDDFVCRIDSFGRIERMNAKELRVKYNVGRGHLHLSVSFRAESQSAFPFRISLLVGSAPTVDVSHSYGICEREE